MYLQIRDGSLFRKKGSEIHSLIFKGELSFVILLVSHEPGEQVLCLICSRLTVNSIIFVNYLAYTLVRTLLCHVSFNNIDIYNSKNKFLWRRMWHTSISLSAVRVFESRRVWSWSHLCADRAWQTFDNTSFLLNMFSYIDVYVAVHTSSILCLSSIYTKWSERTDEKFWAHRWFCVLRDALWRSAYKQK